MLKYQHSLNKNPPVGSRWRSEPTGGFSDAERKVSASDLVIFLSEELADDLVDEGRIFYPHQGNILQNG